MLNVKRGDIFKDSGNEPIFVTLNAFIKPDSSVYMSRGAGLGCLRHSPGIDKIFAEMIRKYGFLVENSYQNKFHKYGCVYDQNTKLGAFQVKYHLNDGIDMELIKYSATMLAGMSRILGRVNLNFPGLGDDQINRPQLYEMLEGIFKNTDVVLWRLDNRE